MILRPANRQTPRVRARGFTMVEMVIGMAIAGVVCVSLYAGLARSFGAVQSARHRLRATQILAEKLEVIRLYSWSQITNGFVPQSFTEYYQPGTTNNNGNQGIVYSGTITISGASVASAYTNTMRKAVVNINWVSSGIAQQDRMETLISQYGIQKYIY
jgi:prepilin-type N-terminal cleavage/methylation domain-containing protein